MNRFVAPVFLPVLSVVFVASAAWAQATAQLSGTVRDESGAVLPGVTITVILTRLERSEAPGVSGLPECLGVLRGIEAR